MNKLLLTIFSISLLLSGCSKGIERRQASRDWMTPNGKLKVLTTTAMIGNLVEEIGGDNLNVLTLIQGDSDPHSYQLVKGDDEKLSYANIIFFNGLGLEHGPTLQSYLHNHSKAVSIGDYIESIKPTEIIHIGQETDPHIWMDMSLWKNAIPLIVHTLSGQDPLHAEVYRKNGQILYAQLNQEDQNIEEYLHQLPENKRYLVSSHDAFNYFVKRYFANGEESTNDEWRKRVDSPMGLSPDSQLNAHEIIAIIDHMKKYNVQVLFPETNLSHDAIEKIKQAGNEKGLDLKISSTPLYGDAMGPKGSDGDTYVKMIWYNAKVIRHELE
jgi:ABC-type metal ion transport system, periplasmic component/surface adhesin